MNGLILFAVLAGVALIATNAKASPSTSGSGGTGLPVGKGGLSAVTTTQPDGTVKFTRDTAVALWRALKSHAYATDPAVAGRIQVAPESSGSPLPTGKAATDWAMQKNIVDHLYLLAPIYMAFDSKGPRYLRATTDLSIAKTGGVYAILANPGEAAAIDTEAMATPPPTPPPSETTTTPTAPKPGPAGGPTITTTPEGVPVSHETIDYDLVESDVELGPVAFAARAGYDSVDAFFKDNPQLTVVVPPPEGWPPIGFVAVDVGGTVWALTGTGRLKKGTSFPTYTRKGEEIEWYFPHWADAVLGDDPETGAKNVVWHNAAPAEATDGSDGKIYGVPSTIDPTVINMEAVRPWFAGQTVKIQKAHPLINL